MVEAQSITSTFAARVRQVAFRLWGGIRRRVFSFSIMAALVLVASPAGDFFSPDGKKKLDAKIRIRALYAARELAASAVDVITRNRIVSFKKFPLPSVVYEHALSGSALPHLMNFNHTCSHLIVSMATVVFFNRDSYYYSPPSGNNPVRDDIVLSCGPARAREPLFVLKKNGVYGLTLPLVVNDRIGLVRVGMSSQRYEKKSAS